MEQYPVPYQVAMIQMASDFLNRKENLAKAEGYIRTAAANGAKLICLPESFDVGYISTRIPEMMAAAENEQCETVLFMKALAKELGVHILAPAFWKSQDGAVENRAYLIDDEGTLLGSYSKLVDDYQELREFDAATQTVLDLNDALRGRKQKKP